VGLLSGSAEKVRWERREGVRGGQWIWKVVDVYWPGYHFKGGQGWGGPASFRPEGSGVREKKLCRKKSKRTGKPRSQPPSRGTEGEPEALQELRTRAPPEER